ncbi:MAG: peroxidase family protein [Bacteroidota bacterium]
MQSHQKTEFHLDNSRDYSLLFPELQPLSVSDQDLITMATRMKEWTDCLDSKVHTNGDAIFGQFLAHDITFEITSRFRGHNNLAKAENNRSILLDLDSLYGQWTEDFLYDATDKNKLLLGECISKPPFEWWDLQRNAQGKAIIPDARNDENIIVAAMQVLFIQFHNAMVERLRDDLKKYSVYQEARQVVTWHYQWITIHHYLKKLMEPEIFQDLWENGPRYYTCPDFLPLEFSGAAFRMGHSQTREDNWINEEVCKGIFELGSFGAISEYVDWHYFFDFGDNKVQPAKKIDTKIAPAFLDIPFIKSDDWFERSLPYRNLKRGKIYGLPSGESVAHRLGIVPIEVPLTQECQLEGTPLWFYMLYESEYLHEGERMGPVGSRILGEVFFGIMRNHDQSFLKVHPLWRPHLGRNEGDFDFVDMVNFACS